MGKIIRRVISILLTVTAVILICIPSSDASAATQRGDFLVDGDTLVSYTGQDSEVTLPNTIRTIGKDAFSGNNRLTKVVIPESVKTIDYAAFENCSNLQIASIGNGVRTIGSSAFSGCKNLYSVNIPEKCDELGSGVFAGCTSLSSVPISAGNRSFVCADGVIYSRDGHKLIMYLPGRTSSTFVMPRTVDEIGEYSFWGSDSLTSVTASRGVKEIPEYAFSNCNSLSKVILPTSVESLMAYSFADCPNLSSIAIPDSVGYIDDKAFYMSNGATIQFVDPNGNNTSSVPVAAVSAATQDSMSTGSAGNGSNSQSPSNGTPSDNIGINPYGTDRPDGYTPSYSGSTNWMTIIKDRDFSDNLKQEDLGASMIVGGNAIMLMSSDMPVRGYDLEDAEAEDSLASSGGNTSSATDTFNIINGVLASYNGKDAEVNVPNDVNKIGNRAFYKNEGILKVSVPADTDEIMDFAFARSSLETIDIPNGVKRIGYAAFYHCDHLENVNIPSSVNNIELGAFDGSLWLNNWRADPNANDFLVVGDGILLAYKGAGGDVSLPSGIKQIAPGCFEGNTAITDITLQTGVEVIGEDAFNGCKNLTSLALPEGLGEIQDRAFCDTGLEFAYIPDSVERIGLGAFDTTGNMNPLKTVIFKGTDVPNVVYKDTATRMSGDNLRTDAFEGVENAIVQADCDLDSGTLFNPKYYGFHGQVYSIAPDSSASAPMLSLLKTTKRPDASGTVTIDSTVPAGKDNYMMNGVKEHAFDSYLDWQEWCDEKPNTVHVVGNMSADLTNLLKKVTDQISDEQRANLGINVQLNGNSFFNTDVASASIPEASERFSLVINEDEGLRDSLMSGLYNAYGPGVSVTLVPFDMSLYDSTGTVLIHKFGQSKLEVTLPLPQKFENASGIKVASLDENGSLTELPTSTSDIGDVKCLNFVANHCSAFGIYIKNDSTVVPADGEMSEVTNDVSAENALASGHSDGIVGTLTKKVVNIEAKWFIIVILLCVAVVLFIYKPAKRKE